MQPMKLVLSRLSPALLRTLALAVASSDSSSSGLPATDSSESSVIDSITADDSSSSNGCEPEDTSEPPSGRKPDITDLVGDLRINGPSMRRYVGDLCKGFFDALHKSSLYIFLDDEATTIRLSKPSRAFKRSYPSLSEEARARMLDMSPRDFEKRCDQWCKRRTRFYQYKSEKYNAEKKGLEYRIACEEKQRREHLLGSRNADPKKASDSLQTLRSLRSSLRQCVKRCNRYSIAKLQNCRDYCSDIKSLSRRLLGDDSVFALYRSHQKRLQEERHGRAAPEEHDPPSEKTSSSVEVDHEGCMVCYSSFKPGEEPIHCVNGNRFHASCLSRCRRGTCPLCRGPFAVEQERRLAEYVREQERHRERCIDYLSNLYSDLDHLYNPDNDLDLEEKYMRDGIPIDRSAARDRLFMRMCTNIRRCVSTLKDHPGYSEIFDNPGSNFYRRFYIPPSIVSYLEGTAMGHHDPRSRGFAKHKAVMIKRMLDYKMQLKSCPYFELEDGNAILDHSIAPAMRAVFNIFCAADSLLEYLYTRLHDIEDPAERRSAMANNPHVYPALHSLMSRHPDYSFVDAYYSIVLAAHCSVSPLKFYTREWLLRAAEVFSEMMSEV